MIMLWAGLLAAVALGASAPQDAAPTTPPVAVAQDPDTPTQLEDVVVSSTLEQLTREFVATASAPANYRGLARWERELCLGVVGLRADAAHQIIDRVSDVARELEVPLGEPGCAPNAVIIGTDDARGMAARLVGERRSAFRIGFSRSNRGSRALETFRTSEDAVRWWHISFPYGEDGKCLAIKIFQGPEPCGNSYNRSYRGQGIMDVIRRAIIILDVPRLEGTDFTALSDYLAMLVLAQIDPNGETGRFDTVLNLPDGDRGVSGLTEWDWAYLTALYDARPNRLNQPVQADALMEILSTDPGPANDAGPADEP
ncbi:hypothetical protein [Brevundimonas sp.]|uniref:hypothetical protein n=1 Tax=Brevundimonas sp. TaxID=1871086 RepID=UPI00260663C1|nr:hypothetical protein [Brevundimonas sp.]